MKRTRRDVSYDRVRRAQAHALKMESEHGHLSKTSLQAWNVVADAIEEAGAGDIRRRYEAYEEARQRFDPRRFARGGGYDPAEVTEIERLAGAKHPTNDELGRLEAYEFVVDPPERLFAYYDDDFKHISTFGSTFLGLISHRGRERRPMGGRVVSVRVWTINGFMYHGTCNLSSGTYCRLRRGRRWR